MTISPLNSLENIEGQAWNLRRTCTFSEDNTESIKGFDGFSKEINYSPRMKLEDAITPQFKSIGNIYKDIESSTDDYIINDKSTDEHHSPAKQLNIIYASSFNKNYDSFNWSFAQKLNDNIRDNLSISLDDSNSTPMCSLEKLKCGCKLF